jgi:hypothetical protein
VLAAAEIDRGRVNSRTSLASIILNSQLAEVAMDERIGFSPPPIAPAAARASRRTIGSIARRAVPALADFAIVFVVAGRHIVGIASAHTSPGGDRLLRALQRIYRVPVADLQSTVAQVIRTGQPSIRKAIRPENGEAGPRGSVGDIHRRLGSRSALVMPLQSGAEVFGALTLCYAQSGRVYSRADIPAARRIAREIARAVAGGFTNGASRLRAATGHTRTVAARRRRVAARN